MGLPRRQKLILGLMILFLLGLAGVVLGGVYSLLYSQSLLSSDVGTAPGESMISSVGSFLSDIGGRLSSAETIEIEGVMEELQCADYNCPDSQITSVVGTFVRMRYPAIVDAGDNFEMRIEVTNGTDRDWPEFNLWISSYQFPMGDPFLEGFVLAETNPPALSARSVPGGDGWVSLELGPISAGERRMIDLDFRAFRPGGYGAMFSVSFEDPSSPYAIYKWFFDGAVATTVK